jgi:hypothetical protein
LQNVLKDILSKVAKDGLPGDHHFYIVFRTCADGVDISDTIRETYPEEMTIVLQHQFWDMRVHGDSFSVKLSFNGTPEQLVIPFSAVSGFVDPSVPYGLQFASLDSANTSPVPAKDTKAYEKPPASAQLQPKSGETSADKVVQLDSFRLRT